MMPPEVEFIIKAIKEMPDNGLIVEWGSGGSTCKWLETISKKQRLISIEHNREWYEKVLNTVSSTFPDIGDRFTLFYKPEKLQERYNHGYGDIAEENPFGMDEYVLPTPEISNANIFIVDGLARGACVAIATIIRKNKDSLILIHDYSPRVIAYNWISQLFDIEIIETMAILKEKQ